MIFYIQFVNTSTKRGYFSQVTGFLIGMKNDGWARFLIQVNG
ncbi:hypothetical protein M067_4542 [Bacteroides fragilis str. J-143-4]|uniref:Uncharacterized protein n=1 Tax=Bacteroides fragilis str. 3783N1-6 TaxID=1339310 RepID=A0AB73ASY9_BACFG|nr:hypothetical protein M118_4418 [Bacteroides fragilis str. 3783N1-2]EXY48598.1 hypothetical protein M121_4698 [Bacteroides fragilis str. 3783N2-1]EXY53691.1 hypothetical protein M122_4352 [Bacteroides fragilis str. 3976T7]EXZ17053.1 hypothetical protein M067_4542 [Bacteroides fragilis str. J-143-4]EXZ70491.1 hypothetical protein M120_5321 [Bacteroides fragilis str. 3783N1-8]EYB12128.1 hypothetical protein M119_4717 [Bacteroides fragilis str. 3783N1-6]